MSKFYTWYTVAVREPNWATPVRMWDKFESIKEAEEYLKDLAPTYPEGTLLFVISNRDYKPDRDRPRYWNTAKSWVVNEYGDLVKRQRRWVPEQAVPVEWIKELPEEPPDISKVLEQFRGRSFFDVGISERDRAEIALGELGLGEGERAKYRQHIKKGYFPASEVKDWRK